MYIWVGAYVDDQLKDIRQKAHKIEQEIGFKNSCYTLPLHISLKMSFPIDQATTDEVISTIENYYQTLEPFELHVKAIEKEDVIVWIRMKENERLNKIHDDLNDLLLQHYGVGLHEYDCDYKFHTTLFMSSDLQKIDIAYQRIKHIRLPKVLRINRFIIGASSSGALGSYSVIRDILK